MRLLAKFSLIFVAVFGLGLGLATYLFNNLLQETAREQVHDQAELMMETALAMRSYTQQQVKPALEEALQPRGADSSPDDVFREICARKGYGGAKQTFRPQRVPAYAATEMFGYLKNKYPEYTYKEAALNPTNPRDRAVDWEEDIIKKFKNNGGMQLFDGERMTPFGRSLYLAAPMRAARGCLQCHSTPAAAPAEMVQTYGPGNGFGWVEGDVIAAQIVSVPASLPIQKANRAFRQIVASLVVVGLVTLVVLDLLLYFAVIRPVGLLAARADDISKGQMDMPELPVRGNDEISILATAFNRMHRSLATAMKMLE